MFSKFKLNNLLLDDFNEYKQIGQDYYEQIKTDLQSSLKSFIVEDGVIDGTRLQQNWFPIQNQFNVFLSHSHNDEMLAISLAGFLKEKLNLNTFIDSCLWGYSNDLLRKIDKKYCRYGDGVSFDYDKRNYSTSHVHMMLSIALSRMIDNCEAIFFLNSENSISLNEEIKKKRTSSPWIYSELSIADMIEIQPISRYRGGTLHFEHGVYDLINESLTLHIQYDVDEVLKKFIPLSFQDLMQCSKDWKRNKNFYENALDYIYLSKNIIKQNVLYS